MDDAELVRQFQVGQVTCFGQLYDQYIEKVYAFIYYRTRHQETAEDITSLVFTKALEHLPTFSPDAGTFQAWLYRIARNAVIDHYRTSRQTDPLESAFHVGQEDAAMHGLDDRESLRQIRELLHEFTPEQRDVVLLRVWDGLSYREIGQILGKSEDSCKMLFSRTIRKIRDAQGLAVLLLFLDRFV